MKTYEVSSACWAICLTCVFLGSFVFACLWLNHGYEVTGLLHEANLQTQMKLNATNAYVDRRFNTIMNSCFVGQKTK